MSNFKISIYSKTMIHIGIYSLLVQGIQVLIVVVFNYHQIENQNKQSLFVLLTLKITILTGASLAGNY